MKQINVVLVVASILLAGSCTKNPFITKTNPLGDQPLKLVDANQRTSQTCVFSPCLGEGEIGIENIPVEISEYISSNYASAKVKEAEVLGCNIIEVENEQEGENETEDYYTGSLEDIDFFVIELNKNRELLFSADGSFIAEQKGDEKENKIDVSQLSTSITAYIVENYPEETIKEASEEISFGMNFIEVETTNKEFIFDSESGFVCVKDED